MKKVTLLLVMAVISLTGFSQIKFGIKAGPNFSNYKTDGDTKMKIGFHAGAIAEVGIGPIQAETGAAFSQTGYKTEDSFFGTTMESELTINQIEVPLMLGFQFGVEALSVVPQVGGYLNYALSGDLDSDKVEFGSDPGQFNPVDYGLRVGVKAQVTKIRAGLYYNLGLQNLKNDADSEVMTRNFIVSAAFMF